MSYSCSLITDRTIWDQFLLQHAPFGLFQDWTWGEVMRQSGSAIERYGVFDGSRLVAIFQLVTVAARRGRFIHVRHGPVLAEFNQHLWQEVTNFLRRYSQEKQALFFRISPLIAPEQQLELTKLGYQPAAIHAMDAEYCWVLPLAETEETLLSQMRKTTRYEIRRAISLGVEVSPSTSPEALDDFLALYKETSKRQGFVEHQGIREECESFAKENKLLVYTAKHEGQVIAAAIILFVGNQGIYHHGASITNKVPGSYLIQWEAIKEAKRRGLHQYNFWGIAPPDQPDHPWKGLTLFKTGFGGQPQTYLHAQDFPVSPLYIVPKTIELIRKIRKGY